MAGYSSFSKNIASKTKLVLSQHEKSQESYEEILLSVFGENKINSLREKIKEKNKKKKDLISLSLS